MNMKIFCKFLKYNFCRILLRITPLNLHRPTFPHLKDAVSSAKRSLTARFGMELGVSFSL